MPLHDWQFWLVTALALSGVWIVLRTVMPIRRRHAPDAGCPTCTSPSKK